MSTQATASAAVGDDIFDGATLADLFGPAPSGTVTFKAFGPADADCSGTPAFTSSAVPVSGNGNYLSGAFTTTTAGTYLWVASYSGDADNAPIVGVCGEATETTVVAKATPTLSTQATASAAVGDDISDVATFSGLFGPAPGGTVSFEAFGPADADCSGTPAFTSPAVPVTRNGDYPSGPFTTMQVGTYLWVAHYSGDTDNAGVDGVCNDANETTVVGKATPTLSTQSTASAAVGDDISDVATLSGFFGDAPGGTVSFEAFGPADADCSGTPAFTSSAVPVTGNGDYPSGAFTTTTAGTYLWVAHYSGDADNAGVDGVCGDANETTVVAKATPTLSTQATPSAVVGGAISDAARLVGLFGDAPGGTVTFKAFGPADTDCSGTPAFTSSAVPVTGNGDYPSGAFTSTTAGTYYWVASYSGDADNAAVVGACRQPQETTTVVGAVSSGGGTPEGSTSGGTPPSSTPSPSSSPSPSPSSSPSPSVSAGGPTTAPSSPAATAAVPAARTPLTLTVRDGSIPSGSTSTLVATGAANQPYQLRCYTRPSTTYFTARSGVIDAAGDPVTFTLTLGRSTRCLVRYADDPTQDASASVVVSVRTVLSLSAVRTGTRTFVFQGRNLPRAAGQLITLYRLDSDGSEIRTSNLTTDASGVYRVTRTFTGSGLYRFRVRTSQTLDNAAGASVTIAVTVR